MAAIAASGCGNSTQTKTQSTQTPVTARVSTTPPRAVVPPAAPHLSILSPRAGAHTGSTLTVRVAISGTANTGARRLRYVLDRRLTRLGSARLTFHALAPGRHRLEVFLSGENRGHASTTFTVRAPAPVANPLPAQAASTVPASPAPTTTTMHTPEPTTSSPPPPSRTTPPASGGIPQNGGGDGDGDNSGGPSDGDGNL
ncbi:MAG TPA: hypothetical protein VGF15_02390 [Solirubrobacteraceae bacterium]